jgi:hypothetical protein
MEVTSTPRPGAVNETTDEMFSRGSAAGEGSAVGELDGAAVRDTGKNAGAARTTVQAPRLAGLRSDESR